MNLRGFVELENSTIVVGFKKSCPLLISHHGALCIPPPVWAVGGTAIDLGDCSRCIFMQSV